MRKLMLIAFLLVTVSAWAQNRSVTLPEATPTSQGGTYADVPLAATDLVGTSETYYVVFTCKKDYPMQEDVQVALTTVSGSPSVACTLYGRTFVTDSWVQIGSPFTFTGSNSPSTISSAAGTANRYRFFKLAFVASGATQSSTITGIKFKGWYTGGQLLVNSITDGTASITAGAISGLTTISASGLASVAGVDIGTSKAIVGTTAMTIGNNAQTVAVNSSDWDITATGVMTGIGDITTDGTLTFANSKTIKGSITGSLSVDANFVKKLPATTAINSTDAITAAQMLGGIITSTSGAATTLTTPTATAIMALIPGGGRGTTFDLIIDNSAGSNTVTLALDASIAVVTPAITGGAALTVATNNVCGLFRFYFTSGTTAKCFRIY